MGLIHLDAGVVIGLLDADDAHHVAARQALDAAQRKGDRFAMAASAFAECLVGPSRRGPDAVALIRGLFDRLPIDVTELDAETATVAAELRARHRSLRLPYALVLATAARHSADELITTDHAWPTADRLALGLTITSL